MSLGAEDVGVSRRLESAGLFPSNLHLKLVLYVQNCLIMSARSPAYPISKLFARTLSSAASSAKDAFGPPPAALSRRVVVTGLGVVSPLAVGTAATWERLLAGATGVRALLPEDLPKASWEHWC